MTFRTNDIYHHVQYTRLGSNQIVAVQLRKKIVKMNMETDFELRMPINIHQLNGYMTPEFIFNRFSWQVETKQVIFENRAPELGIFIHCNIIEPCPSSYSVIASATMQMKSTQKNMRPMEKQISFMHFNPENSKRGYDRFIRWNDLERVMNNNQITLHMKIHAIALSNANNLVNVLTLANDGMLKVQTTFKDILTNSAMISPGMVYGNGSLFRICIFKQRYISEEDCIIKDALWVNLCCQIGDDDHLKKWSYKIKLLTSNEELGSLCTEAKDIQFSKKFDSNGAPFINLDELFSRRNKYLTSNGEIIMEFELMYKEEDQLFDLNNVRVKTEPKSPKCLRSASPPLVMIPRRAIERSMPILNQIKVEVVDEASVNEFSSEVTDLQQPDQCASVIVQANDGRKRAAQPDEINCLLCASNLLEVEAITTKCGHLYCKLCLDNDIATRKMCVKCDYPVKKDQCIQIYCTDEQRKKKRCSQTRASSSLRSFLDKLEQELQNRTSGHLSSNQDPQTTDGLLLKCPMCDENLFETKSYTLRCGHLYCEHCLTTDIANRQVCVVCNKQDRAQWTQIFFS